MIKTEGYYTGNAVNLCNRWKQHRRELCKNIHYNTDLQLDWNKYGEQAFEFSILELCEKEMLLIREQWYFDNEPLSYNICPIAGSCLGVKRSDEFRARMSGELNPMFGKHHSEETRENMSEAQKGNKHALGYKHTEVTRAKVSEAAKNRPPTSEVTRAKLSAILVGNTRNLGHKHTDETLANMSIAQKGNTNALGHKKTEESCAKHSEAMKKVWALKREAKLLEQAYMALLY